LKIQMTINHIQREAEVEPLERLIDMLRNRFGLTSVKEGCGEGECGACTIIVNQLAVTSCTMLAVQVNGCQVLTTEGLMEDGELDRLQQAFIENGAIQCGYCTPGMLMSVKALLLNNLDPTREEIIRAMEGNLCRCTGYLPIINAVESLKGDGNIGE
jgi:aerobic-type carbon monoxide dehydrogenase small subunit (CoxS/CutS family)